MSNYRIGDLCWFKKINLKEGTIRWIRGALLAWSSDFEELNQGIGQYPVGVLEDLETNLVISHPVHLISFASSQPTEKSN